MGKTKPQPATFSRFRLDFGPMAARRRYLNMTQRQLAAAVGVHQMTIHRVEANRANPTKHLTVAVARALGVPEHDLYTVRDLETVGR